MILSLFHFILFERFNGQKKFDWNTCILSHSHTHMDLCVFRRIRNVSSRFSFVAMRSTLTTSRWHCETTERANATVCTPLTFCAFLLLVFASTSPVCSHFLLHSPYPSINTIFLSLFPGNVLLHLQTFVSLRVHCFCCRAENTHFDWMFTTPKKSYRKESMISSVHISLCVLCVLCVCCHDPYARTNVHVNTNIFARTFAFAVDFGPGNGLPQIPETIWLAFGA